MKRIVGIIAALAMLCPSVFVVHAVIDFGSQKSGFVVHSGILNLGAAQLANCSLRVVEDGELTGQDSSWEQVILEQGLGSTASCVTIDGEFSFDDETIILSDNQQLILAGGVVDQEVVVAGTPSFIKGHGSFSSAITVNNACQLNIGLLNALNVNIVSAAGADATVKLENDLIMASGKGFTGVTDKTLTLDFNGYALQLGDGSAAITKNQSWQDASVSLNGSLLIAAGSTVTFSGVAPVINGHGNTLSLINNTSKLHNGGLSTSLTDVVISGNGLASDWMLGAGDWHLDNVVFDSLGDSRIAVTGDIVGVAEGTGNVFNGIIGFENATISLRKNCSISIDGTWQFFSDCILNGEGNVFSLSSGTLKLCANTHFVDVSLTSLESGSIHNAAGEGCLYLSNVMWETASTNTNGAQSIRINSMPGDADAAGMILPVSTTAGDIFNAQTTYWQNAEIELASNTILAGAACWDFVGDAVLNGNGNYFNLADGALKVSNDATLYLRNIVLDAVNADSLLSGSGTIDMSNVTIKITESIDWTTRTPVGMRFVVTGPVTVVTGSYTFVVPSDSYVDGVTLLYDTLGALDNNNVRGFSFVNNARAIIVDKPVTGDVVISATDQETFYLDRVQFLNSDDRTLSFDSIGDPSSCIYDGLGRTLFFPVATDPVLLVDAGVSVAVQNILLDGLLPSHLDVDGSLVFGDKTIIRLEQDWLLDRTIQCGSSPAVTGQEIVIDLNGFTIDMSDPDAAISLQGGEPVGQQVGNTLRLCNGRVSGLSSTKLSAVEFTKIILENVELVLNSDFTYDNAALDIEGNCVLSGQAAASLIFQSDADLKIKKGALLTVLDGINYIHNSSEETNFVFEAVSSRLMLLGGNFICSENASSPLVLSVGTLIVDHLVTIDVGAFGMVLSDGQDPLSVEILPGALIKVSGSGTLSYSALA